MIDRLKRYLDKKKLELNSEKNEDNEIYRKGEEDLIKGVGDGRERK